MAQMTGIAATLSLLALLGGLLYLVIRCALRFPIASLIVSAILVSGSVAYYKNHVKQLRLSYVPEGLEVRNILYANEESWGFGPGGNETGVIVYELPDAVAEQISKVGIDYFASMPPQSGDSYDWHGRYEKWNHTPIRYDDNWAGPESDHKNTDTFVPKIETYLDRYGFSIPIDPAVEKAINVAISQKGSFFAYGRIGMLIIVPQTRRVVYAYNG